MSSDLISRQAAINALGNIDCSDGIGVSALKCDVVKDAINAINTLSSAQLETSIKIQEILDYLNNTLHPLISPDNWNVYSELYDMISKLPSAQTDWNELFVACDCCGHLIHIER